MELIKIVYLDLLALSVLVAGHHLVSPRLRLANLLGLDVADLLGLLDKGVLAGRPVVDMVAIESICIGLWFSRGCGKSSSQHGGKNESLSGKNGLMHSHHTSIISCTFSLSPYHYLSTVSPFYHLIVSSSSLWNHLHVVVSGASGEELIMVS